MIKEILKKIPLIGNLYERIYNLEKKTNEIYWAAIFNNTIKNSSWYLQQAISPGRWAMNYSGLYLIYRVLNEIEPLNILEFGLGQSSKILLQYIANKQPAAKLKIIEHNKDWVDFFLKQFPLPKNSKLVCLALEEKRIAAVKTTVYANMLEEIKNDEKYNFIIVDGPFGSAGYSRFQIYDLIKENMLAKDFVIILDDYERQGEKDTGNMLYDLLDSKKIKYYKNIYAGEKEQVIICSEKYKYAASL